MNTGLRLSLTSFPCSSLASTAHQDAATVRILFRLPPLDPLVPPCHQNLPVCRGRGAPTYSALHFCRAAPLPRHTRLFPYVMGGEPPHTRLLPYVARLFLYVAASFPQHFRPSTSATASLPSSTFTLYCSPPL